MFSSCRTLQDTDSTHDAMKQARLEAGLLWLAFGRGGSEAGSREVSGVSMHRSWKCGFNSSSCGQGVIQKSNPGHEQTITHTLGCD